ncbi:MAG TPA: stage II sporulation protein M [Cytophagaceae bacterium]|nr:stage II sporulation protein M [Cytophagaceae bacterium]
MREVVFLRKNEKKWREVEDMLARSAAINPDKLADLYIELTDDLAFSQTNYPDSKTTVYLNGITAEIYQAVYKNKKEKSNRFIHFWAYELPKEFKQSQKHLFYSFSIFMIAVLIGIVSTSYDEGFVRVIMGDDYVNMTLENIEKGDPMAVYKGEDANSMFYYITTNNIRVSFYAFVMGIAFSIGTAWILFRNGIMLGAFQWFFYKKGLFLTSFLTIWIHGTLEISAIVIAGAAGFVLGNSILFPGTLTRTTSLVNGARRAVKICIGLIPIFITAGFLESYVTRMTDAPIGFKLTIILGSLCFIVYYFILLPILLNRKEAFVKPSVTLEEVSHSLEKEDAQNHLTTL